MPTEVKPLPKSKKPAADPKDRRRANWTSGYGEDRGGRTPDRRHETHQNGANIYPSLSGGGSGGGMMMIGRGVISNRIGGDCTKIGQPSRCMRLHEYSMST